MRTKVSKRGQISAPSKVRKQLHIGPDDTTLEWVIEGATARAEGAEAARHALRLMESFAVEWVSCEANILEIASRIKAHGRLSVAESWIGATAIAYGATLVHKDPEFEPCNEITQEILK